MDDHPRFAELMASSGGRVPLDVASLLIARTAAPALPESAVLGRLDELAASCPAPLLDVMLEHLFVSGRLRGNSADYDDPRNSLLDQVMARGLGLPITLAVVAIEVGRRIGVPVCGVGMPGHFLLRDRVDPGIFIDPFDRGRVLDAPAAQRLYHRIAGPRSRWDDAYLTETDHRSIVVRMLRNLVGAYRKAGNLAGLQRAAVLRLSCRGLHPSEEDELARALAPLN